VNKRIFLTLISLILVLAVLTTGCAKAASGDQSLKKVQDAKTLVLGLDDAFPPMGYRNESNEIVGFDVDVAKEVAKRMGVELKLQPIDWSQKFNELNAGTSRLHLEWLIPSPRNVSSRPTSHQPT